MERINLSELVRKAETNYISGEVTISKYVRYSMYETLNTIDAYLNSKHISGPTDSAGRVKPFFNIITAAVNIWYRATNIDRKDINVLPSKPTNTVAALMATILLQDWMKRERFGVFLKDWGLALARYGSAVVKFVEQGGTLKASVIPWNRLIVDPIDFDALPRIEKLYLTPDQLKANKLYDQAKVKDLIAAQSTRQTIGRQKQDNKANFIEVYEVHGDLPLALLEDDPESAPDALWEKYRQQMHVVSFVALNEGEYDDYTLYKGPEAKDPYMITHLLKEDGRTLSIGAVEYLFDAQWMQNHSMKTMKDTLDLSSRLIFQTADSNYVGRNVLSAIETGDIMIYAENKPLTQINNGKQDINALMAFMKEWQANAQELTSTPEAMRGQTLPSGTPYSLGAYLGAQANSLFEIMTENKGLALEDMLRTYVIPHLKKQLNHKDEITTLLSDAQVKQIDAAFVPSAAVKAHNDKVKKFLFDAVKSPQRLPFPSPYQPQAAQMEMTQQLEALGNMRSLSPGDITWKEVVKDLEWNLDMAITNEQVDKQATLTTLTTVLQTLATNPRALLDPNMKMVFGRILALSGATSAAQLQAPQILPPMPIVQMREMVDFKDLPPDAQQAELARVGIDMQPQQGQQAPPSPGTPTPGAPALPPTPVLRTPRGKSPAQAPPAGL